MRKSTFAVSCSLALAWGLVLVAPTRSTAQTTAPSAVAQVEKPASALAPAGWTAPRTPDGHPDLQGYYMNVSLTQTTRPEGLEGHLFYTPDEAALVERSNDPSCVYNCKSQDTRAGGAATDLARAYNDPFYDRGSKVAVTLQTSIIVDPPDGKYPAFTPAVQKEIAREADEIKEKCANPRRVCPPGYDGKTPGLADRATDFSLMSRCVKQQTSGPPMLPAIYDSNYHIIQTSNDLMIQVEGGRDVRIIPLDGSPHVRPNIHLWLGDSRGHWEGNTLVVDTTNFNDEGGVQRAGRNLQVVERFTKVAPNVLLYEFTADDPTTFTRSWTGIISMTTIKGPIYEFACNEGNYGLADILRGARLEEKKRAEQSGHQGESNATPENTSRCGSGQ